MGINNYTGIHLENTIITEMMLHELITMFGPIGNQWFIYNKYIYFRTEEAVTWFLLSRERYGL